VQLVPADFGNSGVRLARVFVNVHSGNSAEDWLVSQPQLLSPSSLRAWT
jgi:hypothetical protein